jgi:arylsulfatase
MMASNNNILLVTIDSLRADYVLKGHTQTPSHDRLRDEGTLYSNAFSQGPFTTFSMPSLFTSRYPSSLRYMEFSESTVGTYIENEPTLPEALQHAGYETAGFHSNPLLSNLFGFDRGFDTFDARLPFSGTDALPGRAKILADKLLRLARKHPYLPAEKINERALGWLDQRTSEESFFLWLHYMDVHGPYIAKEGSQYLNKYRGERLWRKAVTKPEEITENERNRLQELYRTEVEYTDAQIGELIESLRGRGLWDDTIVAVTSDHGEGFGEHGTFSHPHELYDELTHVPLIVREPGKSAKEIESIVELTDLAPTLVDRVGGEVPDSFTGSVLPESDNEATAAEAISEADITPEYNASVRTERYRYIRNDVDGREELYDIREDPDEQHNIMNDQPGIREEVASRLDDHLDHASRAVGRDRDVVRAEIDDEGVQDRLQDLGYLE